jgi:hypothetical protein
MHNVWRALVVAGVVFAGVVAPLLGLSANSSGSHLGMWLAGGIGVFGSSLLVLGALLKPTGGWK